MRFARLAVLATFALATIAAPLTAEAQQAEKVRRIGYLNPGRLNEPGAPPLVKAFEEGLRAHGGVMGQTLDIEYRSAEGKYDRLPALATQLVGLKVEAIVTVATPATRAAMSATSTIPIVGIYMADPLAQGLVASLARPGGNLTVITDPPLESKVLDFLKQAAPRASRMAVLGDPGAPITPHYLANWNQLDAVAPALGVRLQRVDIRTADELESAFVKMKRTLAEALYVIPGSLTWDERRRIANLALENGLPSACSFKEYAEAGGLIGYAPDLQDMWRRGASYVDKILRGAKVGELPVDLASRLQLVINLKTAKALGLTIPPSVLARADEVIE
jgi:putative ABC transport system substrate-binding protein